MNKNLVSFLFVVLLTTGCQQNVAPSGENSPVSEAAITDENHLTSSDTTEPQSSLASNGGNTTDKLESHNTVTSIKKPITSYERVTLHLLEQGERALAAEHLLTPVEDNANLYFQAVLGRDPGNFRATQGIASIVDLYTDWAWIAAKGQGYQKAERYLANARSVNPEDPFIVEMTSRITDLKTQRQRTVNQEKKTLEPEVLKEGQYLLPKTLFSLTEDEIIAEIQPIIDAVSETGQSIEIYWPNDKEARLIYQIINSRIPEFRVRAMTFHRASNMVELQQD
ncbi:hypothetical protein MUS1_12165 [Marinomonas ushuaiensis DSM 15871]|uniref:Lipoprotein n=1 Tax=Marinomonas ushuaiensis DSM 15871 TaxID=1122207 RepID=X7E7I0_9GAMM|nr:hypothetical protein [Marinomonas ushuaiensis]ETX11123.1 hypothetical protein MUS1_12165 [Marinomonas ushuaiensis DSM 15871]